MWLVSKYYVSMQDHMKILYYTNHAGGSLSSEKWQEGQGEKRSPRLVANASLLRDFSPLRLVTLTLTLTQYSASLHMSNTLRLMSWDIFATLFNQMFMNNKVEFIDGPIVQM